MPPATALRSSSRMAISRAAAFVNLPAAMPALPGGRRAQLEGRLRQLVALHDALRHPPPRLAAERGTTRAEEAAKHVPVRFRRRLPVRRQAVVRPRPSSAPTLRGETNALEQAAGLELLQDGVHPGLGETRHA